MISKDRVYKTRDGREVRIYATDAGGCYPVHGAQQAASGNWWTCSWRIDGRNIDDATSSVNDLIEVKPRIKRTVWINVYDGSVSDYVHTSKCNADKTRTGACLACVKVEIDCEHGEGL